MKDHQEEDSLQKFFQVGLGLSVNDTLGYLMNVSKKTLMDIYEQTGGNNWRRNKGWIFNDDLSTWHGLNAEECKKNESGYKITAINLHMNYLRGSLPRIMYINGLTAINLSNNELTGKLPDFPKTLARLNISDNKLSGSLTNIEFPPYLKYLNLSENHLTGKIPNKLSNGLRYLNLNNNILTGYPPTTLPIKLAFLDLTENKLILPPNIRSSNDYLNSRKMFVTSEVAIRDLINQLKEAEQDRLLSIFLTKNMKLTLLESEGYIINTTIEDDDFLP
eukprot:UN30514